jgi:hypothetical protein
MNPMDYEHFIKAIKYHRSPMKPNKSNHCKKNTRRIKGDCRLDTARSSKINASKTSLYAKTVGESKKWSDEHPTAFHFHCVLKIANLGVGIGVH